MEIFDMNWPAKRTISGPTRWDPFEEIRKTQERLNLLFEDFMPMKKWGGGNVFTPAIDIKDEGNKLLVTTDLPGINKEDIELNLKENMLEISAKSGKKKKPKRKDIFVRKENILTFTERFACLQALKRRRALQKFKMVS
jgi:HSP20 family protein